MYHFFVFFWVDVNKEHETYEGKFGMNFRLLSSSTNFEQSQSHTQLLGLRAIGVLACGFSLAVGPVGLAPLPRAWCF